MKYKDTPFRRLLDWCIVLVIFSFTLIQLFSHYEFSKQYLEYLDVSGAQSESVAAIYDFLEITNALSTDMCQYAFTGDEAYINEYFSILNSNDRCHTIELLHSTNSGISYSETLGRETDAIIDMELHIIKLVAVSCNVPEYQMQDVLRSYELTEEEKSLSREQGMLRAQELAFGEEYRGAKDRFVRVLSEFSDDLVVRNALLQADYAEIIKTKTSVQQTMLILTGAMMLLIVMLLYRQMLTIGKMLVDEQQYKGALITDAIGVFEVNLTEDRVESILSEKDDIISGEMNRLKLSLPCPFSEFMGAVLPGIPPADASGMERFSSAYFINQFNNDNRFITYETWYSVSEDRHRFLRTTILLSKRPDSDCIYALVVFRDITAEKLEYEKQHQLVEMSLRSGQQYLDALRTDSVGIYESNITKGIIEHIISDTPDHKLAKFFESSGIMLPGKVSKYMEAVAPMLDEEHRSRLIPNDSEMLAKLYNKGVRNQINEFWVTMPDGNRVYLKNTMLLRREEASGDLVAIVIIRDFTEEQLELEAGQMELLKQKASNEAKTKFFSNMSHDIRTPLNGIIGMIDLVRRHMNEPERVRDYVDKIDQSSRHLLSLVNDVLDMNAIDSGKVEVARKPLNLQSVLEECFAIINSQLFTRDILFEVEGDSQKTPVVLGDAVALRKIFMNILGNAVKFTGDGGTISFKAEYEHSFDGEFLNAKFTIADTGIGMSEEFKEKLFEPFSQENSGARTNYQGTGLGMSIVKQYVDILGGTISVESEKNHGTTFVVELPFEIDKGENDASEIQQGFVDIAGLRILLVDDNELNIEIVQMLLEDQGAIVTTASNGRDAVDAFTASEDGYFDAILMDIMMPIMDGIEATRAIRYMAMMRSDATSVPIIALTANAFASDLEKTAAAGMTAHLSKPIVPATLMETLTRCCRRS